MAKQISDELVIANAFIYTKKSQMTIKQIDQYWRIVDTLLPDNYYTLRDKYAFESFCDEYNFLVKRIDDTVTIICDRAKLERYFGIGIPTEIKKIFDIAGAKLNEIEMQVKKDNEYNPKINETCDENNLKENGPTLRKKSRCTF